MNSKDLIDGLGGTTAVARMLGIKPPSVHAWRGSEIPAGRRIRLALIAEELGVSTRQDLYPHDWQKIWPELAQATAVPADLQPKARA